MRLSLIVLTLWALALPVTMARADVPPVPYGSDFGGFHEILPPGSDGLDNAVQGAAFLSAGVRPQHFGDQVAPYANLLDGSAGLTDARIPNYFIDGSFGVAPGQQGTVQNPRPDVTIVWDKQWGIPHIYGSTRYGVEFGAGYATARVRLFLMDLFRHIGRSSVASFLGGGADFRKLDHDQWHNAPYTDAEFQGQVDALPRQFGAEGELAVSDARAYVDGINQYIREAKLNPLLMPVEYAAIGRPLGPEPFKTADIIAAGSVIASALGVGGGGELHSAQLLQGFQKRFGRSQGRKLWLDFLDPTDPEAPNTVLHKRFSYEPIPRRPAKGSVAIPDVGSVVPVPVVTSGTGTARAGGRLSPLGRALARTLRNVTQRRHASNALLVGAADSVNGHPLAVFGPQVSYFAPEIFLQEDLHGPGIQARGVALPGVSQYILIGHGADYAWSATSSSQDLVDIFAVRLCEPGDTKPTIRSMYYRFRGRCRPIELLRKTNRWTPNLLDQTPAGSETLTAQRTDLGLLQDRGTIGGRPVGFVRARSTYKHEFDSVIGFQELNDPAKLRNASDFQHAAGKIGVAFNWLYADDRDIAYIDGGLNNPQRRRGIDPLLPVWSDFIWKGFDPANNTAAYQPFSTFPKVIDQPYIVNWNNREAAGWTQTEPGFGPVDRSLMLEGRIKNGTRGSAKMSLAGLVSAMEDAATADLRGETVLGPLLAALGSQRNPVLARAISELRAWRAGGSHRIDRDHDGTYDSAEAIRIMDAWWPRLLHAEFEPGLGANLFAKVQEIQRLDDDPNAHGGHLGSAYDDGWYGYVSKDLRGVLHRRVRGPFHRLFCGGGNLHRCRTVLAASLRRAIALPYDSIYAGDPGCAGLHGARLQPCWDQIRFSSASAVSQAPIPWQNRPTYQQVVSVQGHRPR